MTTPSQEMTTPSQEMTIPSQDMTIPSQIMTIPRQDMTTPWVFNSYDIVFSISEYSENINNLLICNKFLKKTNLRKFKFNKIYSLQ